MKKENAIEVRNLKKKFRVYYDKGNSLKEKAIFRKRNKYEERWVLRGIDLDIKKGEAIGLIGHNGCGKSTTLKLLTKIIYPDEGTIEMDGRVSSLIELGAGFHPDMSGKENIYINASIFGLTQKEIDKRIQEIISFSELEEFIDNPVRTYSSGMYMRLAFAVAINVDADILLIDEILAVGDSNFQAKCFNKLREIKKNGTTIVIVSHSLGQIEQICDRSIWIQDGKIRLEGDPRSIHSEYLEFMGNKKQDKTEPKEQELKKRFGSGEVKVTKITTLDCEGKEKKNFKTGDSIIFRIDYKVIEKVEETIIGISIFRNDGVLCYGSHTKIDRIKEKINLEKDGQLFIKFPKVNLLKGEYYIDLSINFSDEMPIDYIKEAYGFEMFSTIEDIGISRIEHEWSF